MPYSPFPLVDFRGLYKAKEPWLAPETAWTTLRNARMNNGRILKRLGYSGFATLGIAHAGENVGDGGDDDSDTLDHIPVRPAALISDEADTFSINFANGGANTAKAWTDSWSSYSGFGLIFERLTIALAAGATNYTGTLVGANNPRSKITFTETGGTTQEIIVDYVSGPQYGPDASPQGTSSSDADPAGANTWVPAATYTASGSYDFTFKVTTVGGVNLVYDRCIGIMVYSSGEVYIDYEPAWPAAAVTCDYEHTTGEPVMGIRSWHALNGNEYLVVADTDYIYLYNATTGNFENPIGATSGTFDGNDDQYFHFCPFENILIVNNGAGQTSGTANPPQKYDQTASPPTCVDLGTGFTGGANQIESAWFAFRSKSRIVYLRTTESTVDYAQRARWTPVNDIEYANAQGDEASYYTDAPTTDKITAAAQIGDEIVALFGTTVWRLRYAEANPYTAYRWEQLPAVEGTASPMGHVSLGETLLYRGHEGINVTDANGVQAADLEIPDEVLTWNLDAEQYSYGIYSPSTHEALLTYAGADDTYAERALVAHVDRNRNFMGWSQYDLPFHCFGSYRRGAVQSWDDAVAGYTIDEIEWTPDSRAKSVEFPIILAGDRNGNIYEYADGDSDNGSDITATIRTIRLNPYPGRRCHLGWIDIITDGITDGEINVSAYANYQTAAYMNKTVNLTTSRESQKVNRRVRVNRIAHLHSIQIAVTSSGPFALDAVTLWCKPAGRMREIA